MRYSIYRIAAGVKELVGTARYIEDARSILENWYSGFIEVNGKIVESKRLDAAN